MVFLFIAIIIISALSIVSSLSLYNNIETLLVEEKGKKAMSVTIAVAKLIEQDYPSFKKLLETHQYTGGSYDAVYYAKMQKIFREIREKADVKFLYCGKRVSEDEMVYLFDGEEPDSALFSPLGSKDNLDHMEQGFYKSKTSGYTPIMDDPEWGQLLTGLTPILDPETGQAVAHVGADVSVESVYISLAGIKNLIMINAFVLILITSLIIYKLLSMTSVFTDNDYLTGLRSKGYQERFLEQLIKKSKSNGKAFPLIMIDFDDFKLINDLYGHHFGDIVLKSVSDIIKVSTRSADCSARYGGDEFVIILPEANLEYALLVSQWLQKEVSGLQLKARNDVIVPVSISIGIALWKSGMTSEQILDHADKALYHSKRTGKNKTVVYTDELA
jgi:diguanylate cyclase (GGDEF)-like protein